MNRRPSREDLKEILLQASKDARLVGHRAKWPRYLYRLEDVRAAASILRTGSLLSRNLAMQDDAMITDSASPEIVGSQPHLHDYARLYFRPRTPTQFYMEGIRGQEERDKAKHAGGCVPVILCFKALDVLTRDDLHFTFGNATASGYPIQDDPWHLKNAPWQDIYHDAPIKKDEHKSQIVTRRCAEVLIPDHLPTDAVQEVICRSTPEADTLRSLLKGDWSAWKDRVRVPRAEEAFFYATFAYVASVQYTGEVIDVQFSNPQTTGRVVVSWHVWSRSGSLVRDTREMDSLARLMKFRVPKGHEHIGFALRVDHFLAFQGALSSKSFFA